MYTAPLCRGPSPADIIGVHNMFLLLCRLSRGQSWKPLTRTASSRQRPSPTGTSLTHRLTQPPHSARQKRSARVKVSPTACSPLMHLRACVLRRQGASRQNHQAKVNLQKTLHPFCAVPLPQWLLRACILRRHKLSHFLRNQSAAAHISSNTVRITVHGHRLRSSSLARCCMHIGYLCCVRGD